MASSNFFAEQIATAQQVLNVREQAKIAHEQDQRTYYQGVIDRLVDHILDGWREKVANAAKRGFFKTNIFRYGEGAKFEEINMAFLISGPREDREYWAKRGIKGVLQQVREVIEVPGRSKVKYWYTGARNGNVFEVIWDPKEFA